MLCRFCTFVKEGRRELGDLTHSVFKGSLESTDLAVYDYLVNLNTEWLSAAAFRAAVVVRVHNSWDLARCDVRHAVFTLRERVQQQLEPSVHP